MSLLRFISLDEIEALDDHDPQRAFIAFVTTAQTRLSDLLTQLDPNDQAQWEEREELRHSFINVVIAAAKKFQIEPFYAQAVPRLADFKRNSNFPDFQADLDHYMTQMMLDSSSRNKRDSVAIPPKAKDKIRDYVRALRECIENEKMDTGKRAALLEKLDELERELEKRRLSLLAITHLTLYLLAVPGALWSSADVAAKLVTSIMQIVAESKASEQESLLLQPPETRALSPPRPNEPASESFGKAGARRSAPIDDDIPF